MKSGTPPTAGRSLPPPSLYSPCPLPAVVPDSLGFNRADAKIVIPVCPLGVDSVVSCSACVVVPSIYLGLSVVDRLGTVWLAVLLTLSAWPGWRPCLLGWVSWLGMGWRIRWVYRWVLSLGGWVDGWHPSGALTDDGGNDRCMSNWVLNQHPRDTAGEYRRKSMRKMGARMHTLESRNSQSTSAKPSHGQYSAWHWRAIAAPVALNTRGLPNTLPGNLAALSGRYSLNTGMNSPASPWRKPRAC